MNQNGFDPRSTPGYSYGQPNTYGQPGAYPQTGYPAGGAVPQGGAQNPAAGYQQPAPAFRPQDGVNGTGPQQSAGYVAPQSTGPVSSGAQGPYFAPSYGGQNPAPYSYSATQNSGYSPVPPAPVTGGYNPVPQTTANGGYGGYVPQPPQAATTGSFIPQTPYSPGYTSPGYQPAYQPGYQAGYQKPAANGYPQGYSAYGQMGKTVSQATGPQQPQAQIPLNGGGYVPQQPRIRRRPIERRDLVLYVTGGILVLLFILSALAFPDSAALKWLFLIPAVGTTALLWLRPVTDDSKRLCYTIVACALCIATIIGLITMNPDAGSSKKGGSSQSQSETGSYGNDDIGAGYGGTYQGGSGSGYGASNYQQDNTPTPAPTSNVNAVAGTRLLNFFECWGNNDLDSMVALCAPSWQVKQENAKKALFSLLQNRRPTEFMLDNISGPQGGDSLTFIMKVSIDKNNGKPVSIYQMSVRMVNESGQWYVDPNSLVSNEIQETPDPNATPVVTPTPEPYVDANTVLYYNPDGGKLYHSDQNCVSLHSRYLPLKGKFTYGQINDQPDASLEPCNVCGAPLRK